jgi:DNA-binding XRE family transcriptional regulator
MGRQWSALKLRMLRLNAGLSPEELGAEVELSGMTIRRLEAGTKPTVATAYKLAQYFEQPVTDMWPELVGDQEPAA